MNIYFLLFVVLYSFINISESCNENCHIGKSHCDPLTGSCLYGCKPGWSGDDCREKCNIHNCLECYNHQNSVQICDRCKEGFYGDQCNQTCNDKCLSGRCNAVGDCVFGCKTHFTGRKCDKQHCEIEQCLKCGFSMVYYIPICEICSVGKFFSYQANRCVNCSNKCIGDDINTCNQTTGICFHGCEKGYYGTNCDRLCSIEHCEQCVLARVNSDRAKCTRCSPNWYPQNYGCVGCSQHCLEGIENCNSSTGHCEKGCELGWFGSHCDKQCLISNCFSCAEDSFGRTYCAACNNGMYFDYKNGSCLNCTDNCLGGKSNCNKTTGSCINGCISGYYGDKCQWICGHCVGQSCNLNGTCPGGCQSGYYGDKCQWICGHCVGQSCNLNGTCPGGCQSGWYNSYCTQKFPEHCIDGVQFQYNGTCEDCEAFWYGDICDKKCSLNCRPSVYNGYIYCHKKNGKCVAGCLDGHYGESCNLPCNPNCNYGHCDQTSGVCNNGCELKYYGKSCNLSCPEHCDRGCHRDTGLCNECQPGFYGTFCNQSCGEGCKDGKCYKIHGACSDGCVDGYYGNKCDVNCSENCKNSLCDLFSGKCTDGCTAGYYGQFCQYVCNNCRNSTCEQENGNCVLGCTEGMSGENCNEACPSGTFGEDCLSNCANCRNKACDAKIGECHFGCAVGYTGSLCQDVVPLYPSNSNDNNNNSIAVASSVTVSVVLTLTIIVIILIIVRRKKNLSLCTKMRKSSFADPPGVEMETIHTTQRNPTEDNTIDPADLQLYPVIVTGQRFEIKFGKYCSRFRTSPVMVRILPNGCNDRDTEDFYTDVDILKSLPKQKNVVFFLGTGINTGYSFSVFELCGNGVMLSYLRNLTESSRDHTSSILKENLPDIMKFCLGVVSGLEYLLYKKILHRHIAAINIFLDEDGKSKIGNFFYAVNIESETEEIKLSQLPDDCLPWLPRESKKYQLFSPKSEIYSFGMFLWELMTLGEDVGIVMPQLSRDEWLPRPDGCDRTLYRLMTKCWHNDPQHRPSLQYIYQLISDIIDYTDNQVEIEEDNVLKSTTV